MTTPVPTLEELAARVESAETKLDRYRDRIKDLEDQADRFRTRIRTLEELAAQVDERLLNIRERRASPVRSQLSELSRRVIALEEADNGTPGASTSTALTR